MKSFVAFAALAATALAAPAFAQAQSLALPASLAPVSYSASAGYTGISDAGNNLGAVTLRAGADLGKYAGVEGEGAFGVADGGASFQGASVKTHLNYEYAAYAVARYPVLANANLFARVGYGHEELHASASANGSTVSATAGTDSLNYGVGGQYMFNGKDGLRLEWTRFDFRHDHVSPADSWTLSYVRKF